VIFFRGARRLLGKAEPDLVFVSFLVKFGADVFFAGRREARFLSPLANPLDPTFTGLFMKG